MEFYHHLPSWAMNEQMSYFSSFSDEWGRDLKSVQVQKQRSCRVTNNCNNRLIVNIFRIVFLEFETQLEDGTVTARVDLLGKVIPRRAIEDKLSKLVKTSISVDGKLVHALVDSGTEITVIKKDLVPGISVEGASTIYLKGIFGPAVKCPLVYVPIGLATGGQVNVVHQQVLCALAEVLVEDVLLPPDVLDMLGGAQSEEKSLAQSSLRT
ncbi:uncharacterized protein TNCV_4650791 [Trichonephila clavipes]|nr:uncharacterized protein TNCV_4650791 [Trichonephila clavipes]